MGRLVFNGKSLGVKVMVIQAQSNQTIQLGTISKCGFAGCIFCTQLVKAIYKLSLLYWEVVIAYM